MKNIKFFIGILISVIITYGLTSYAYKLNAIDVTYDNKNTTLESGQVQGALNELGILATARITSLENEISDGKSKVAAAITKAGVDTSGTVSFDVLATNIGKISKVIYESTLAEGSGWTFEEVGQNIFDVNYSGIYLIEAYGAQGGASGSKGSYLKGYISLNKDDKLYLNIGGTNGYNGGGSASNGSNNGGGSSDVRLNGNKLSNRILVAGGGSGSESVTTAWNAAYIIEAPVGTNGSETYPGASSSTSTNVHTNISSNGTLGNGSSGAYSSQAQNRSGNGTNNCGDPYKWYQSGAITTYTGGGGGGYYGGNANSPGTSYVDITKIHNFDETTKKISDYSYSGTPGENNFTSSMLGHNIRTGNGYIKITYISAYAN